MSAMCMLQWFVVVQASAPHRCKLATLEPEIMDKHHNTTNKEAERALTLKKKNSSMGYPGHI